MHQRRRPEPAAFFIPPIYSLAVAPLFHIALHEPEIPNNTGNIGRTCVTTGCSLHLIRPLGFDTSIKALRRAGLDYWPRLNPAEHDSLDAYLDAAGPARLWAFSTKATRTIHDIELNAEDHLLFGKETRGLPDEVLARLGGRVIGLPMLHDERSLNLATAVCAAVYVGIEQLVRRGRLRLEAGRLPPCVSPTTPTTPRPPHTDRSAR